MSNEFLETLSTKSLKSHYLTSFKLFYEQQGPVVFYAKTKPEVRCEWEVAEERSQSEFFTGKFNCSTK